MSRGSGKAQWIRKTHLFRADEYICSVCGRSYPKPYDFCPGCGARPGKVKYDLHWVAEMEMMDILFDDDEDF